MSSDENLEGTSTVRVEPEARTRGPVTRARRPEPCTVVIFGATGDLAYSKLIPALYELSRAGSLPQPLHLVGFARRDYSDEDWRGEMREELANGMDEKVDPAAWDRMAGTCRYVRGEFGEASAYTKLSETLEQVETSQGGTRCNRLFYLAAPPGFFPEILARLAGADLIHPARQEGPGPWSRVVIEKPFGHDLPSARELNRRVSESLEESQVYRIDHYLGKETVQNILIFRFGNSIFEPLWNRKYIDHIQITAAEVAGVEGRAGYYDREGVVRDMVQNHMLQLLTLCAMEAPVSFGADAVRDEKVKVLQALRPISRDALDRHAVHGQYLGYHREDGVEEDSRTPTYVALRLHLDNWRWQGVPFYLRTGKKLGTRRTEISVHFQHIPLCLFGTEDACAPIRPNVLTMAIQPDEGIRLHFTTKVPGEDLSVGEVTMDFHYARAFERELASAYERLLLDCMRGDPTLFARSDEIEEAWRFLTPLLEGYEEDRGASLALYSPGTPGPREGDELLEPDGRAWEPLP